MNGPRAGGWSRLISATVLAFGMVACTPGSGTGGAAGGGGGASEGAPTGGGAGGNATGAGGTTAGSAGTGGVSGSTGTTGASSGTAEAGEESFEGTAGITDKPKERMKPVALREVRSGRHPGFDRITFEFDGQDIPGYHLEFIDHLPRQCASGEEVMIAGSTWLSVRMKPAQRHSEAGVPYGASKTFKPGFDVLKEATLTCDFEGDVTWVLGLASASRYRVLEVAAPPRLVVDVKAVQRIQE